LAHGLWGELNRKGAKNAKKDFIKRGRGGEKKRVKRKISPPLPLTPS
jgi:hypothetical protein